MKKNLIIIMTTFLLMFCGINVVHAGEIVYQNPATKIDMKNIGDNLKLCEYEVKIGTSVYKDDDEYTHPIPDLTIVYSYDKNAMYVTQNVIDKLTSTGSRMYAVYGIATLLPTYNGFESTKHDQFYMDGTVMDALLNKGKCPAKAYYETHGNQDEICFDNGTNNYCFKDAKNSGTDFNDTVSSKLTYDWQTHMDNYFNNTFAEMSPTLKSCDELDGFSDRMAEQLNTDIRTNFLSGNPSPLFLKQSDSYINGMENYRNKLNQTLDKFKNDNSCLSGKTQEEKEQILEQEKQNIANGIEQAKNSIELNSLNKIDWENMGKLSCTDIPYTIAWLQKAFNIIKIVAPLLVLVYGSLDYAKVVFADKDDELKKAGQRFLKRLIAAIIIFVLPDIIDLILDLAGIDVSLCDIG